MQEFPTPVIISHSLSLSRYNGFSVFGEIVHICIISLSLSYECQIISKMMKLLKNLLLSPNSTHSNLSLTIESLLLFLLGTIFDNIKGDLSASHNV